MTDHLKPHQTNGMQQPGPHSPLHSFNGGPPPPKRPRLDTTFSSQNLSPVYGPPFGSPGMGPYNQSKPISPYSALNNPQPMQATAAMEPTTAIPKTAPGVMGPPEKPKADRATDINDLSDLVNAAGVDLKAEESYLTAVYKHQRPSQAASSSGNSFYASQDSSQTLTPETSFAQWSQSPAAGQLSLAARPTGPLSQPALKPEEYEKSSKDRQAKARAEAQKSTKHLSNPFLESNTVRERLHRRTYESQIRLKQDGFRLEEIRQEDIEMRGVSAPTGENEVLVAARAATITQTSALADVLSLISLATHERLRAMLEDSYATARSRVYGEGGLVPPDWADLAFTSTKSELTAVCPKSVIGTVWDALPDSAVSPMTVIPSKRTNDDVTRPRLPTPSTESEVELQDTVRFPSQVPSLLIQLGNSELEQERKRIDARKQRRAAKEKKEQEASTVTADDNADSPSVLATPPFAKDLAPPPEAKMTKKERERQKKENKTEDVLRAQANATAAHALGKTSKKYSWLTKASSTTDSGSLTTGAGQRASLAAQAVGAKKPAKLAKPAAPSEDPALVSKKTYQQLGLWKEAPGVELRDIVNVLERDVKEKKALMRGYQRLAVDN